MKTAVYLGALGLVLAGCSSYQGGTATETDTEHGQAYQMRSPSSFDRAKGTNVFEYTPPMEPIGPGSGAPPE